MLHLNEQNVYSAFIEKHKFIDKMCSMWWTYSNMNGLQFEFYLKLWISNILEYENKMSVGSCYSSLFVFFLLPMNYAKKMVILHQNS